MHTVTFSLEEEELIEDEMEAGVIREALAEHRSNPRTFRFDDEMERLSLE